MWIHHLHHAQNIKRKQRRPRERSKEHLVPPTMDSERKLFDNSDYRVEEVEDTVN